MKVVHRPNDEDQSVESQPESEASDDTNDDIDDQNAEEEEEDSDYNEVWHRVITEVMEENGRQDLKKEGRDKLDTKRVIKAIRDLAEDYVKFGNQIENTDLYDHLRKEKDRLVNNDYDSDEAEIVAWKNRKYLVKKLVIDPFLDKIEESEYQEEGDQEEMNSGSFD
jgi:hypothetical protein